jgi:hypothetical protein
MMQLAWTGLGGVSPVVSLAVRGLCKRCRSEYDCDMVAGRVSQEVQWGRLDGYRGAEQISIQYSTQNEVAHGPVWQIAPGP